MGRRIIQPKQGQHRILREGWGIKVKNKGTDPFLTFEKLTLGFCTKGKIYLLLLIIYVLLKAFQKDPLNIKGIKDPHSHSPWESFTLLTPSKYVFQKKKKKDFVKEQLNTVTLFLNVTHPSFNMPWGGAGGKGWENILNIFKLFPEWLPKKKRKKKKAASWSTGREYQHCIPKKEQTWWIIKSWLHAFLPSLLMS